MKDILKEKIPEHIENKELKDRIKELELQNFNLKEDIMIKKMSLPSEEIKDKNFLDLYNMPTYEELKDRIDKANWWLEEMLKQAKNDETKAIICGALELLLKEIRNDI